MSLSQSPIVPCPPIHLVSHPNPPFWGELHLLRRFLCPKISFPLRTGKWSWVNLQVRISPCLEVQGTGLPPAALLLQETPSLLPALENQDIFISLFILREPMSFFLMSFSSLIFQVTIKLPVSQADNIKWKSIILAGNLLPRCLTLLSLFSISVKGDLWTRWEIGNRNIRGVQTSIIDDCSSLRVNCRAS